MNPHQEVAIPCPFLARTESDLLPPTEEELTHFPVDKSKTRPWCHRCYNSFVVFTKNPLLFGTSLRYHGEGRKDPSLIHLSRLLHYFIHRVILSLFRLKTMFLSLKSFLFLVIAFNVLSNCVSAEQDKQQSDNFETLPSDRFYDKAFLAHNWVYNRNVTCGKQSKTIFPSRTWTCANIRVNGHKLAYSHYPFKPGYRHPGGRCFETEGRDDIGGICLGLMENVNETAKLWVASITNATCDHTNDNRVLLTIDNSNPDNLQYVWDDFGEGFGWVETLHCLTLPDEF